MKDFINLLIKETGLYPSDDPSRIHQVGDYGTVDKAMGRFVSEGNIFNRGRKGGSNATSLGETLGIQIDERHLPEFHIITTSRAMVKEQKIAHNTHSIDSHGEKHSAAKLASANSATKFDVNFKEGGAAVLIIPHGEVQSIRHEGQLAIITDPHLASKAIITSVWTAPTHAAFMSHKRHQSFSITFTADGHGGLKITSTFKASESGDYSHIGPAFRSGANRVSGTNCYPLVKLGRAGPSKTKMVLKHLGSAIETLGEELSADFSFSYSESETEEAKPSDGQRREITTNSFVPGHQGVNYHHPVEQEQDEGPYALSASQTYNHDGISEVSSRDHKVQKLVTSSSSRVSAVADENGGDNEDCDQTQPEDQDDDSTDNENGVDNDEVDDANDARDNDDTTPDGEGVYPVPTNGDEDSQKCEPRDGENGSDSPSDEDADENPQKSDKMREPHDGENGSEDPSDEDADENPQKSDDSVGENGDPDEDQTNESQPDIFDDEKKDKRGAVLDDGSPHGDGSENEGGDNDLIDSNDYACGDGNGKGDDSNGDPDDRQDEQGNDSD